MANSPQTLAAADYPCPFPSSSTPARREGSPKFDYDMPNHDFENLSPFGTIRVIDIHSLSPAAGTLDQCHPPFVSPS